MVYGGTGSPNPHAVTEVNGTAYTYDANGNLLSDGTHSYTWDKRNRLIGGSGQSFSYDFSGQRYKTVDSAAGTNVYTYYITPLMELRDHSTSSAGTAVYNIFAGSQRVATVSEGLYSYVLQDHLGGTALITDESGAVTEVYDYYPYGAELIEDLLGTTETAHTFTDKEFSEELGLYYFEARWYNPTIGRFASLDPAQLDGRVVKLLQDPQSLNFYAYSRNNPINLVDPSGEFFLAALAAVAAGAWAVTEVALTVVDSINAIEVIGNSGSSWSDKALATGGLIISTIAPGGGYGTAASKVDDAMDAAKTVDNLMDGAHTVDNVKINGKAPEYSGGQLSETEFLDSAESYLGPNYSETSSGRFVSEDGSRQVRYGEHEITSPTHHGHFESYNSNTGKVDETTTVQITE